jgi:hypothetical protein
MDPHVNAILLILAIVMLIITGLRLSGFGAVRKRRRKVTLNQQGYRNVSRQLFVALPASVAQLATRAQRTKRWLMKNSLQLTMGRFGAK